MNWRLNWRCYVTVNANNTEQWPLFCFKVQQIIMSFGEFHHGRNARRNRLILSVIHWPWFNTTLPDFWNTVQVTCASVVISPSTVPPLWWLSYCYSFIITVLFSIHHKECWNLFAVFFPTVYFPIYLSLNRFIWLCACNRVCGSQTVLGQAAWAL